MKLLHYLRSTWFTGPSECPVCSEPLLILELEGVEVDRCPQCRGLWLDAGELELLLQSKAQETRPEMKPEASLHPAASRTDSKKRRCPRCARPLHTLSLPGPPAVVLDRCPKAHGFWLDAGELDSLLAQSREGVPGTVARFLADVLRHDLQSKS